jgi:hypothetical protein
LLLEKASPGSAFTRSSSRAVVNVGGGTRNVWLTSIADSRWKMIKVHLNHEAMLFDLENDPGETRDCSAEYPEECSRLARELDRLDALLSGRASKQPTPAVHEEQKRKLKALGYL